MHRLTKFKPWETQRRRLWAEATNFNEQLGRLDSSIKAANNLASSAKRSADISKEALIASEAQFRPGCSTLRSGDDKQ